MSWCINLLLHQHCAAAHTEVYKEPVFCVLDRVMSAVLCQMQEGNPVSGAADKIAPASSWEDGSILYTSSILEGCSYEDVLQG